MLGLVLQKRFATSSLLTSTSIQSGNQQVGKEQSQRPHEWMAEVMCAGFMSFRTINGCWLVRNLLLSWLFFLIYKPSKSLTTVLGTIILTRGTKSILQCTRSWSWCPPVSKHFTCSVTWPHVDMLWMKSL